MARKLVVLALMTAIGFSLYGCKTVKNVVCKERAYKLKVVADDSFVATTTVQVDFVAANAADLPRWQNLAVDSYRGGGKDVYSMSFGQGKPSVQALEAEVELWERWLARNVTHVFVIATIPGMLSEGALGPADARMVELPLDECRWEGTPGMLKVSLGVTGLRVESPQKPL